MLFHQFYFFATLLILAQCYFIDFFFLFLERITFLFNKSNLILPLFLHEFLFFAKCTTLVFLFELELHPSLGHDLYLYIFILKLLIMLDLELYHFLCFLTSFFNLFECLFLLCLEHLDSIMHLDNICLHHLTIFSDCVEGSILYITQSRLSLRASIFRIRRYTIFKSGVVRLRRRVSHGFPHMVINMLSACILCL